MASGSRKSDVYSSSGNHHVQLLENLKEVLAPIAQNPRGDTDGLSVDDPLLQGVRQRASKVDDPLHNSTLPSPTQVCYYERRIMNRIMNGRNVFNRRLH